MKTECTSEHNVFLDTSLIFIHPFSNFPFSILLITPQQPLSNRHILFIVFVFVWCNMTLFSEDIVYDVSIIFTPTCLANAPMQLKRYPKKNLTKLKFVFCCLEAPQNSHTCFSIEGFCTCCIVHLLTFSLYIN